MFCLVENVLNLKKLLYAVALNLGNTGVQMFGLNTYLSHIVVVIDDKYFKANERAFCIAPASVYYK